MCNLTENLMKNASTFLFNLLSRYLPRIFKQHNNQEAKKRNKLKLPNNKTLTKIAVIMSLHLQHNT